MSVEFKDGARSPWPIWENVFLIEAGTDQEAEEKARRRAAQDEGDPEGTFMWDGRPARWVLRGIRKILKCEDETERPRDGTEITYSEYELDSEEALGKLLAAEDVVIRVID